MASLRNPEPGGHSSLDSVVDPKPYELGQAFCIQAHDNRILADDALTAKARHAFDRYHGAAFSDVVDANLLQVLLRTCRQAQFEPDAIGGIGHRFVEKEGKASRALRLALKRPSLLRWLEQVSGSGPLEGIQGRMARMEAGQSLGWHKDSGPEIRRLAIVINLSEAAFTGGEFEMRRQSDSRTLLTYSHQRLGSAMIFKLGSDLQHRVLPITAGGPRQVFAGWLLRPLAPGEMEPNKH